MPFGAGVLSDPDDEPLGMGPEDALDDPDEEMFDGGAGDEPGGEDDHDEFGEEHELAFERSESDFDEGAPPRPRRRDDRRDDRRGPGGPGGPRGRGGRRQGRDAGRNGFGRPKPLIQDIFNAVRKSSSR